MWVGKEKPSNSPAAEQQHLLIVRVPILAALTSRRWPDFSWQEVPVGLKSSETLPPVVKAKNCVPGRGAEEGSWAAEGGFGRQIGESGARHDGEQMGLHFHPPPPPPTLQNPASLSRRSVNTTFGVFWSRCLPSRAGISETDPANLSDCFPRCWLHFSGSSSSGSTSSESPGCRRGWR